ncbi:MAG: YceI family protein [Blastocatellia bacterium]|nr:YceI family protein [Blastocatellia bacterium]
MVRKAVVVFSVATFFISAYGATPFAVDTAHSNVGFSVPIAGGLAQVSGKFSDFKVDLNFDEKDITKSTVETTIKASSIDTGIERRDAHLRTPDFFDAEKFPEIKFKSKGIAKKGKGMTITGDFTMHGVTKEITFPLFNERKLLRQKGSEGDAAVRIQCHALSRSSRLRRVICTKKQRGIYWKQRPGQSKSAGGSPEKVTYGRMVRPSSRAGSRPRLSDL